jgi:hypothetical protein
MKQVAMSASFLGLARELRDKIYMHLLVGEEDIDLAEPWAKPDLSVGLVSTNRMIQEEAAEILYGQNRFDISALEETSLTEFLESIGPINSRHMRHIRIDFPGFGMRVQEGGEMLLLDPEIDRMFEQLQNHCCNLRRVTLSRASVDWGASRLNDHQRPGFMVEAFDIVESRIRAISARRQDHQHVHDSEIVIAVEVNAATADEEASTDMRLEMAKRGWVLDKVDVQEDDEIRWDDYSDRSPEVDWDREDDGASDYDIDNDSDFWRRAGD